VPSYWLGKSALKSTVSQDTVQKHWAASKLA
jgi:hypothetical protein